MSYTEEQSMEINFDTQISDNFKHFEETVISKYGLLLSSTDLVDALGFCSLSSLRQACRRGHIKLKMFKIDGRTGKFALSTDVADYLWQLIS